MSAISESQMELAKELLSDETFGNLVGLGVFCKANSETLTVSITDAMSALKAAFLAGKITIDQYTKAIQSVMKNTLVGAVEAAAAVSKH